MKGNLPAPAGLHFRPAALAFAGFLALAVVLYSGAVPCVSARYLHVPCPACGSTRSTRALLSLDFAGALRFNPLGPVMAALLGLFCLRLLWVTLRDGNARAAFDHRLARLLPGAMIATYGCEVVLWALRFFGLFGGPCPV